jgi:hypothetical protein
VDVVADEPAILRRLPRGGGQMRVGRIDGGERHGNVFAGESFGRLEQLVYVLTQLVVRRRGDVPFGDHKFYTGLAAADDEHTAIWDSGFDPERGYSPPTLRCGDDTIALPAGDLSGAAHIETNGGIVAACVRGEGLVRVLVGSVRTRRFAVDAQLEGVERATIRLTPRVAIVADDLGRLIGFDVETGRLAYDFRL